MTTDRAAYYDTNVILNNILGALGIMKGYPFCTSCGRKVVLPLTSGKKKTTSCPYCHHPNMAIRLGDDYFLRGPRTLHLRDCDMCPSGDQQAEGRGNLRHERNGSRKASRPALFESCIKRWLEKKDKDRENGKLAPSTYGNYATYVNVHFSPLFYLDTTKITAGQLQDFYDNLKGSPKQKKNVMDALRNFFRWLLTREEIKRIPPWPEMDQVIEHERWTLTYDEQQEVLTKIPRDSQGHN